MYHPRMPMTFPVGSLVWVEHHVGSDPGGPWIVTGIKGDRIYTLDWDTDFASSSCIAQADEVSRAIATFAGVVKIPSQT
jgi:hypothetical protein